MVALVYLTFSKGYVPGTVVMRTNPLNKKDLHNDDCRVFCRLLVMLAHD